MNSSNEQNKVEETGRVIAQALSEQEAQKQKNMMKAEKRKATLLEKAAEKHLAGN